jgi:hypothetical protein
LIAANATRALKSLLYRLRFIFAPLASVAPS